MVKNMMLSNVDCLILKLNHLGKSDRKKIINQLDEDKRDYVEKRISLINKSRFLKSLSFEELEQLLMENDCSNETVGQLPNDVHKDRMTELKKENYASSLSRSEALFLSVYSGADWLAEYLVKHHNIYSKELSNLNANCSVENAVSDSLNRIVTKQITDGD